MWVHTAEAYVAIEPKTNDVTVILVKSDVSPEAGRSPQQLSWRHTPG